MPKMSNEALDLLLQLAAMGETWLVDPSSRSTKDSGEVGVYHREEIRLRGQPSAGPYYDFTFRSDGQFWEDVPTFTARARKYWTNVVIERRTVKIERSAWVTLDPLTKQ